MKSVVLLLAGFLLGHLWNIRDTFMSSGDSTTSFAPNDVSFSSHANGEQAAVENPPINCDDVCDAKPCQLTEQQLIDSYHDWFYESGHWSRAQWLGIPVLKSPNDLWSYQMVLVELKPRLVVEFGTAFGGSATYFASILGMIHGFTSGAYGVLSVDVQHEFLQDTAKNSPNTEYMLAPSTDPAVAARISELRRYFPGPMFVILDSDHSYNNVLSELEILHPLLQSGDYLVVEDSNLNGHPVFSDHGPGPHEAVEEHLRHHPGAYIPDPVRNFLFGWSFATDGYLVKA
eukprot:Rmarinus@m.21255